MQCSGSNSCVYPATLNGKCPIHSMEEHLELSLHEVTNLNVKYSFDDVFSDKGVLSHFGLETNRQSRYYKKLRGGTERRGRPKKVATSPSSDLPVTPTPVPMRRKLRKDYDTVNQSINHKFEVDNVRCYVIVSMYDNGQPGEIFLKVDKVGSVAHGMADAFSTLFSMALQYGIPLQTLITKFKHMRFYPSGMTSSNDQELKFADSIIDYLMRWMEKKFIKNARRVVAHCHLCNEDFYTLLDSQIHDKLNLTKHQTIDAQKKYGKEKADSTPFPPLIGESNA